ncbi:MAG TPA: hypothetical protein VF344_05550 [Candidatus Limnocylindrales bacterium]
MPTPGLPQRPPYGSGLRPIEGRDLVAFGPDGDELGLDDYDLDLEGYERTRSDLFRAWVGRGLIRLGWLGLAAGFALGSAGIVAATQQSSVSGVRTELTYQSDKALSDRLDAAVRDLARLKDDVDSLGDMARKTLASLSQVNQLALDDASLHGTNNINSIDAGAAALSKSLDCKSWSPARELELRKTNSSPVIDRYHSVCLALESVAPLRADWESLMAGSQTAMQVAGDINTHDSTATDALVLATQGRYPEAIDKLAIAAAAITDASSIADDLAKVTDVSTLSKWLSRTTQMDDALRLLWQTMIDSKGRVTIQVTAALKIVADAKALLPASTDVLQVVMYELAGRLTSDGISIETAKGALANALANLVDNAGGGAVGGA